MLTPELKVQLVGALVTAIIYYLPAIVIAILGMIGWIITMILDKIKDYTPDSIDQVLDKMSVIAETLVHDSMDEATRIKNDPVMTPDQKKKALSELRDRQAIKLVAAVKVFTGTLLSADSLFQYAKAAIERAIRWVKRDFSFGNSKPVPIPTPADPK